LILRRKKYCFNPVTLTYDEIKPDWKKRFKFFFFAFLVVVFIGLSSGYVFNRLIGSPEAMKLEKQKNTLQETISQMIERCDTYTNRLEKEYFISDNTYRTILQIDTLPLSMRLAGTGGSRTEKDFGLNSNLSLQLDQAIDKLRHQLQIQSTSFETVYSRALEHSAQLSHLPAIKPVSARDIIMISNDFGMRTDPFLNLEQIHTGLDFVAPQGSNVYATADGIVTFTQYSRTGYGNEIVIDHKFGFGSRYAHLNEILVELGQTIQRGQLIGRVGETGRATGPHLHYEVLQNNKPVNPSFYYDNSLTLKEYDVIVQKALKETN
jgi:murein DD-endopeptidase MepM/ murein hydrolase activator NlpD